MTKHKRLWETFHALTAIDSPSFGERKFCDELKKRLIALGVEVYEDNAGDKIGGDSGNLYGYLPGDTALPPVLLSAHMDTVEPGKGKRAIVDSSGLITSAGDTVLGADDVAGITIILEAITRLRENGRPHRPVELLFPAAEEKYGVGSAVADYSRVASKEAYTLDLCGSIGEAANAAPTIIAFEVSVKGKAAHAGFVAKEGIHAINAVAGAIAALPEPLEGTICNIGQISGGIANNIVPDLCRVSGEIRSLFHDKALAQWEAVKNTFEREAARVGAIAAANMRVETTAYTTPLEARVVQRFKAACAKVGVTDYIHATMGGSDNNNFALRGIEGIVIACSMHDVHSTREYSRLGELQQCVELVLELVKG
jgi:tripeptide aminopeptidase